MFVKQLKITAFRGIESLDLTFQPGVNVLIGTNGVGKSSALECFAILLSEYIDKLQETIGGETADYSTYHELLRYKTNTINSGADSAFVQASIVYERDCFTWSQLFRKIEGTSCVSHSQKDLSNLINRIQNSSSQQSTLNIPIVLYYPVNRSVLDFSLEFSSASQITQMEAFKSALTGYQAGFDEFFKWFRELEDLENEERSDRSTYRDYRLEAVRKAIPEFLPNFTNLRIRRSPLRMTVLKQGKELTVNQLSDGEKCLLAMVGDLARRLAIANPGLPDPLQGSGIVLIDEIELHLHPQWQRGVIPKLTSTFPNCQFIVSTHSPQIVSDVRPESIYILQQTSQGVTATHPDSSYGRDTNRILEDLMGVPERPQWSDDGIRNLFRLIDDGDLNGAKELKAELEQKIGLDEPEFAKADVLIRRKEILGK
jgi:predicted ATP-binding protein involved in virulence